MIGLECVKIPALDGDTAPKIQGVPAAGSVITGFRNSDGGTAEIEYIHSDYGPTLVEYNQ